MKLIYEDDNEYHIDSYPMKITLLKSDCPYTIQAAKLLLDNLNNNSMMISATKIYKQSLVHNIPQYNIAVIYHLLYQEYRYPKCAKKLIKYYKLSINLNNSTNNLGFYYKGCSNFISAVKYWTIAYNNGSADAACNLGDYHKEIGEYDIMVKYFLIGIEKKHNTCAHMLAKYYDEVMINYPEAIKYYKLAKKFGNIFSSFRLASCYLNMLQLDLAKKYLIIGIKKAKCVNIINPQKFDSMINITDYNDMLDTINILHPTCLHKFFNLLTDEAKAAFIQLDTIKNKINIIDIINNCNSYNLMANHYHLLNSNNKNKFNKINNFDTTIGPCDICCFQNNLVVLSCHQTHIICKQCAIIVNNCPYCRTAV
jgi:tetratricopeptide (TPR) repeat protein